MKYYFEEKEKVLAELKTGLDGLDTADAAQRLEKEGRNELKAARGKSLVRRFLEQLSDPMILILIAAAAVSAAMAVINHESMTDVFVILFVVIVNAVLGVMQESKAEKAIEALQKMSAATSKVLRDGKTDVMESALLVPGDIVLLEAGDAVPADGRLIECASLRVEEAALTGESVPVEKKDGALASASGADVPLGDRKNMVYMGSTAVYGRGRMVVTGTGMNTEMGKIAGALEQARENETPLQKKLKQLSRVLTWLVLAICAVVFAVQVLRAGSFSAETILNSFMIAVSLAVAAIPEGLAAVVTVVLSIGVTKMSKRSAIIRRLTAVETLGCAQIICSDKTGTLTQNRMTVVDFFGEDEKRCAAGMALCSDAELNRDGTVTGEPTEAALVGWANKLGIRKYELKEKFPRSAEAPFDSERKMMSTLHPEGTSFRQYTKGAPDVVISRCAFYLKDGKCVPMTQEYREQILRANKALADKALRVLALAERVYDSLPSDTGSESLEQQLCFVGLAGMIDPIRPEVKAAIDRCRTAGIRPVMITGDHVDTASAIGRELGILREGDRAVTGSELDRMDDAEFEKCFRNISVYARVQPEHKTRIVKAWQDAGCVTAMTGDGVNDAPSIKNADIGVGMGITGTDVTKNVADMVLADDNFATIVGAVEEGRRIYDNIRKAIQFLLSGNMSEVLSIFTATLMGFTLLKPVHLLWINLLTDTFPALALGMEKGDRDIMNRHPRDAKAGLFAEGMGIDILWQGIMVTVLVLLSYLIGSGFVFADSARGMTMAFITMSLAEVFHSLNMRSRERSIFALHSSNPVLFLSAAAGLLITVMVVEVPFLANLFGFTAVTLQDYAIALLLALVVIPAVEAVKAVRLAAGKRKAKKENRAH